MSEPAPEGDLYPPSGLPLTFADGISHINAGRDVVKIYFQQTHRSLRNAGERNDIVAELVMPMTGFIQAFAFLSSAMSGMVKDGVVKKEEADNLVRHFRSVK